MDIEKLREQLEIDEGVVHEIYLDHLGYPTFGIGHLGRERDVKREAPVSRILGRHEERLSGPPPKGALELANGEGVRVRDAACINHPHRSRSLILGGLIEGRHHILVVHDLTKTCQLRASAFVSNRPRREEHHVGGHFETDAERCSLVVAQEGEDHLVHPALRLVDPNGQVSLLVH